MILCGYMMPIKRSSIMTPERIAVQGLENSRRRLAPRGNRSYHLLLLAVGLSVLGHLLFIGPAVVLSRVGPLESNAADQGAVELLVVKREGAEPSLSGQPDTPTPRAAESQQAAKPSEIPPEKTEAAPVEEP